MVSFPLSHIVAVVKMSWRDGSLSVEILLLVSLASNSTVSPVQTKAGPVTSTSGVGFTVSLIGIVCSHKMLVVDFV